MDGRAALSRRAGATKMLESTAVAARSFGLVIGFPLRGYQKPTNCLERRSAIKRRCIEPGECFRVIWGSSKSFGVSHIGQRVPMRNVMLAYHRPSRQLSVTERVFCAPASSQGKRHAQSFRSVVFPWQSYQRAPVLRGLRSSDDALAS